MPNIADVEYATFARWTVAGATIGVGTRDEKRSGVEHAGILLTDAALEDEFVEGIAAGHPITLRVADRVEPDDVLLDENGDPILDEMGEALLAENDALSTIMFGIDGVAVTVEVETTVLWDDATVTTQLTTKVLTVQGSESARGAAALHLSDLESGRLTSTLRPRRSFSTSDWPALRTDFAGRPVPRVFGTVPKVPATLVSAGAPYRFVFSGHDQTTALAVYRDGRLVPVSEYSVSDSSSPFPHMYVEFAAEQADFNGALYTIEVDAQGFGEPTGPSERIRSMLSDAGVTPHAASFDDAATYLVGAGIEVAYNDGWGEQTSTRALIEELLAVARGTLYRTSTGQYGIVLDRSGASSATFDVDAGDRFEVMSVQRPAKPSSVSLSYRPGARDPKVLQHTITRTVVGGTLGAGKPLEVPYIRDHTIADKHLCYLAKRAEFSRRLRARVLATQLTLGQIITVTSSAEQLVGSRWSVWRVNQIPGGCEVECREYDDSIHTYVAGTLPADAVTTYQPDYSNTLPLAPTALTITAGTTVVANDGNTTARITAQCTAPAVNWEYIQFDVIHDTTGEIFGRVRGTTSGTTATAVVPNLRPGEVYKLLARAVNAFGVEGVAQNTFNATAIGGGAAVTTFTAPGHATVPATVASCTAAQGSALSIGVSWPAVTGANLAEYVVERQVNAAGYSEYWRGRATNFVDRGVSYGNEHQYRVRARDTYGNFSAAYATSGSVTPVANILGGSSGNDIAADTVAPTNRTAVSTVSEARTLAPNTFSAGFSIAHSLGKVPIIGGVMSSAGWVVVTSATTTTIFYTIFLGPDPATGNNNSPGDPHTHNLTNAGGTITVSFNIF